MSYNIYDEFKEHLTTYSEVSTKSLPQRIAKALKEVSPNKIFFYDNKPLILYFKATKELTREKIFKKYWNFSEAPIIFIETEIDLEVYNGFSYILDEDKKPIPEKLNADNLNYLSLISGEYFNSNSFKKSDKRLDTTLLKNIKDARELLIHKLACTDKENIANALLGRIIFIRYLIDRKIALYYNDKKQTITNDNLKDILSSKEKTYQFFKNLQSKTKGFNGDWFPIGKNEIENVQDMHLEILRELISGTEIKSGQRSLFDFYDFSIIPIEFISNVYEHFIGEKKQKKDGAYYTPTFLVDYVLKYTVDEHFKKNPNEYNCKVLDPACGSGIFLVETFRKLVAQYEKVSKKKVDEKAIKKLVKDNIFGIDYNKDALQISVFSLYLAMLDYQEPKDIENFKFPYLLDSDDNRDNPNFFENDFFDLDAPYNKILKEKKLDFIIGNPPYGRSTIKAKSFADNYIKQEKLSVGNNDIIQPFMVRVKDFSTDDTQVSFIVTSKVLYNLQTKEFRTKHFFNQFKIRHILELSSVRKQIFENADTPVSIIFYSYSTQEEVLKNTIRYISMKPSPYFEKLKLLLISKSDFKKVSQAKLLDYDYLWKVLVYGSYLDFNFIKRLKVIKNIDDYINKETTGTGVKIGNKKNDIPEEYFNLPYIKSEDFKPCYLNNKKSKWTIKKAEGVRNIKTFTAPSLLITLGVDKKLNLKTAILHQNSLFTASISSIKSNSKETLYSMMGYFNSIYFKYFILNTASSVGIEREQIHNPEKLSLPFIPSKEIEMIAKSLEKYSSDSFAQYDQKFYELVNKLNESVLKTFDITKQEYALIDYASNIVIPWVIQKKYNVSFSQYKYKDSRVSEYVEIFTKHYSKIYEQNNLYFQATIHWNQHAIGIYFKILKSKSEKAIVWKKEENIKNFLTFMQGKTLENLFIQKDIKGFESDGFYVVKPNEIKNWHKAIGYLDFYEFDDAILRAGK